MVTIKDIAKKAGVTPATVSMALRADSRISEKRMRQIQTIAEELGYHPNFMARGLQRGRSMTIGLLANTLSLEVATREVVCLEKILSETDFKMYVSFARGRRDNAFDMVRDLISRGVDGIILSRLMISEEIQEKFNSAKLRVPLVFSRSYGILPENVDNVFCDYTVGVRDAVEHLFELGHRNIRMIIARKGSRREQRITGFLDALREFSLPNDDDSIFAVDTTAEKAKHAQSLPMVPGQVVESMKVFREKYPECTAVLCGNDLIALVVIQAMNKLGVKVPEDFSVIGFDNILATNYSQPALTTINQPSDKIMTESADQLFRRIENRDCPPEHKVIPTELILRESTAPPKS